MGRARHHACGYSWMVVGCWSLFVDHGGGVHSWGRCGDGPLTLFAGGGMVMGARPRSCCFAVCLHPLLEGDGGCSPSFVSLRCVLVFAVGREWWWVLGPVRLASLCARILCWWGMVVGRVALFCGTVVPCHCGCACWWVLLGVLRREGACCRAQLVVVACGQWWWTLVDGDGVLVAICRQWWWWALCGLVGW